jgi:hypothetical protein
MICLRSLLTKRLPLQIDRLNLEGYANLDAWVAQLDERIESILLGRLSNIINEWCAEFSRTEDSDSRSSSLLVDAKRRVGFASDKDQATNSGRVEVISLVHEVRIQNQVIYLDPPIEHARASWLKQLQGWLGESKPGRLPL